MIRLGLPEGTPLAGAVYDLGSARALEQLVVDAEALVNLYERQKEQWERERERLVGRIPLAEMSLEQLRWYYHGSGGQLTKREKRGLKLIGRLAKQVLGSGDVEEREALLRLLEETACARENNQRSPAPEDITEVELPFVLLDQVFSPVGRGRRPASNLEGEGQELDRLDPRPSTFWRRPSGIASLDLYHGFGRVRNPVRGDEIWKYSGPKTSYGGNPGFEVKLGGMEGKVKFGETRSEPFTARVFWALGYHVDPTDYLNSIRVRYDRRLLREFHVRKEIGTTFQMFGLIPIYRMQLQRRYDPLDYVLAAVLRDGTELTREELRRALFRNGASEHPEDDPANFREEFEERIDQLVMGPVNFQLKDERVDSIGPWEFGGLGHEDRRELRGAGLLAAWLGWYDSRFENTRLKRVELENGEEELRHYFSDLGGTLGSGKGFISGRGEMPERFAWTFTRGGVKGEGRRWFRIEGFKPIEDTPAFKEMTIDDARWMARLIAQLTRGQIAEALRASGFNESEVEMYLEKLVSRRDRMLVDLGLDREIPLLSSHRGLRK